MKKIIVGITVTLFVMGFLTGMFNNIALPNELLFEKNNFFFFLNFLIIILAYGLSLVCIPAFFLIYIYEAFMMGLCVSLFMQNFGIKSIIFILVLLIYKTIILFFIILTNFYYYKYITHLINYLFKKIYIAKHNVRLYLKKITIITCFILIILTSYYYLTVNVLIHLYNKLI